MKRLIGMSERLNQIAQDIADDYFNMRDDEDENILQHEYEDENSLEDVDGIKEFIALSLKIKNEKFEINADEKEEVAKKALNLILEAQ